MNATEMREILRTNVVDVIFTKKDGTERNMLCTLIPDFLPQLPDDTTASPAKSPASDTVVSVWDLEVEGWRSFIAANVKDFEYDAPEDNS